MLWIVSGPTSAGKSTFIQSSRCREITGLPPQARVVWPATASRLDITSTTDVLYHYNILRPLALKDRSEHAWLARAEAAAKMSFVVDPCWQALLAHSTSMKAIVLVADKDTLLRRARGRTIGEPESLRKKIPKTYKATKWVHLLKRVDLAALYETWCSELASSGIEYILIDGTAKAYPRLESEAAMLSLLGAPPGAGRDKPLLVPQPNGNPDAWDWPV